LYATAKMKLAHIQVSIKILEAGFTGNQTGDPIEEAKIRNSVAPRRWPSITSEATMAAIEQPAIAVQVSVENSVTNMATQGADAGPAP